MPGPLRKLKPTPSAETLDGSRCPSRLESDETASRFIQGLEFVETPSKRRRLIINDAGSQPRERLTSAKGLSVLEPHQIALAAELGISTTSSADGVSVDTERIQRLCVSAAAREAVSVFVSSRNNGAALSTVDNLKLRAQVLACYFAHVFFMSTSLRREDLAVTAIAVAVLAFRHFDVLCDEQDILHLWLTRHSSVKETKFREEPDADILAKISLAEVSLSQSLGESLSAELLDFDKLSVSEIAVMYRSWIMAQPRMGMN